MSISFARQIARLLALLGFGALLLYANTSEAVPIEVDWGAYIVMGSRGTDVGGLAGSFGTFDVQKAGDRFFLVGDGTLTATSMGFSTFPNTTFSFDSGAVFFEFSNIQPGEIAGELVPTGDGSSQLCAFTFSVCPAICFQPTNSELR